MSNLNPILPVPVLITLSVIAGLLMLYAWIRSKENRLKSTFGLLRRLTIISLAFIIALRPMREEFGADVQLSNLDVLFVLDTTLSMWAQDGPTGDTRMSAAKNDIETIMDGLPGANFALITFQNKSVVQSPFTQDKETVLGLLNSIRIPGTTLLKGSDMEMPFYDMENLLISSSKKENRQAIVFFFSDGEVTHPDATPYDYERVDGLIYDGIVLGYGTSEGGKMKDKDRRDVVDKADGSIAISRIDEENLKNIADGLDIDYLHRTNKTMLTSLIVKIKTSGKMITDRNNSYVVYHDTYYKYVPYLVILLAMELVIRIRENAKVRKKHGKKTDGKQQKK